VIGSKKAGGRDIEAQRSDSGNTSGAAVTGLEVSGYTQAAAASGGVQNSSGAGAREAEWTRKGEIVVEREVSGRPHGGKVLAAIQPHADDIPLFGGGTVAKLIREGYTGY
jgi:hypothetical protein